MPVFLGNNADAARALREAYQSNDTQRIDQAWENMQAAIANNVLQSMQQDIAIYRETKDENVLMQRGYRTLTSKEEKWYGRVIDAMRSGNPKQAFVEILESDDEDDIMPSSIFEEVFRNLQQEHPLLKLLNVQQTGYLTKWILNRHKAQSAAWGTITAEIEKEITSSLDVVDIHQNKLSCFAVLELGMLDLGPTFFDTYIRTCMYEAMSAALEVAAISGTGLNMPIGMNRDLGSDSFNAATGWKQKTAIEVKDFTPANYGALVAKLTKDADGKPRKFSKVVMIINQTEYLTKIMPATTILNGAGVYVNNLFPFPTDIVVSEFVADGQAIMGITDEYFLAIGKSRRNNVIEYSDDYKFLEDQRVFKIVQYADGRAYDNTSFMLLDISNIQPAYLLVKHMDTPAATDQGTGDTE